MRLMPRMMAVVAVVLCLVPSLSRAADQPERPGLPENANLSGRKKIVFISGRPSHGFAQHEQYAGCMLLAKALNENVPEVRRKFTSGSGLMIPMPSMARQPS